MQKIEISRTDTMEVKVVLDQENVTHAEVKSFDTLGDVLIIGRGKARWNPIDHFDPEIGHQVALGRALEKFGRKLAAYNVRLAVSRGQHKRNLKLAREDLQLLDSVNKQFALWESISTHLQNAPQEPTTALEGEKIPEVYSDATTTNIQDIVEDLAAVEDRNKAKLLGANEESTQNKSS